MKWKLVKVEYSCLEDSFKEKFDGYVFIDRDGNESQCLVEYSAYQKTPNPNKKAKKDAKAETINEDPEFLGKFDTL